MATSRDNNGSSGSPSSVDTIVTAFELAAANGGITRLVDTFAVGTTTSVQQLCSFIGNAREIQDAQFLASKKMAYGKLDIELTQDTRMTQYLTAVIEKARRQATASARNRRNRNTDTEEIF